MQLVKQYQYENAKYIRRADDLSKIIAEGAVNILNKVLYRLNKFDVAIINHQTLADITGKLIRQNQRLLKQLKLILDIEFFRRLEMDDQKYNDVYKIKLSNNGKEILANPKLYFKEYNEKNEQKLKSKMTRCHKKPKVRIDTTCGQACRHLRSEWTQKSHPLYIDKKKYKNKYKDKCQKYQNQNDKKRDICAAEKNDLNDSNVLDNAVIETKIATNKFDETFLKQMDVDTQTKHQDIKQTSIDNKKKNKKNTLIDLELTDAVLDKIISLSNKDYYKRDQVIALIKNLVAKEPDKEIYGGEIILIKYMVKVLNSENEYLSKNKASFSIAQIKKQNQMRIEREVRAGGVTWMD